MRKLFLILCICIVTVFSAIGIRIAYTSLSARSFSIDSSITDRISFRQIASGIAHGVDFSGYSFTKTEMDILRMWHAESFVVYTIDIPSETCMVNLFIAVPHNLDFSINEVFNSSRTVRQPRWVRQQNSQFNYLCSYTIYSQYGYLFITSHGDSVLQCVSAIETCLLEIASLSDIANTAFPTAMKLQ